LLTNQRQTINTSQLFAAIQALGSTESSKVAIRTDSFYIYGGAAGSARCWKVRGWKNTKGAVVPNTALCEAPTDELDRQDRVVESVRIPSHVGIEGNVEADRLANLGRESSPLYPKNTSSDPASNYSTQSPRKKRKVNIKGNPSASPFLSPDESLLLLDSLGLVPLYDCSSHSGTDSGSDTASTADQDYFPSDSVPAASTDSEYLLGRIGLCQCGAKPGFWAILQFFADNFCRLSLHLPR